MNQTLVKIVIVTVVLLIVIWLLDLLLGRRRQSETIPSPSPVVVITPSPGTVQGETTSEVPAQKELAWPAGVPTEWNRAYMPTQQLAVYYPASVQMSRNDDEATEISFLGNENDSTQNQHDGFWIIFETKPLASNTLKSQTLQLMKQVLQTEKAPSDDVEAIVVSGLSGYTFSVTTTEGTYRHYVLPKELVFTGSTEYLHVTTRLADPNQKGYANTIRSILDTIDLYPKSE